MRVQRKSSSLFKFGADQSHLTFSLGIGKTVAINSFRTCCKILDDIGSFISQRTRYWHHEKNEKSNKSKKRFNHHQKNMFLIKA